jgi:hypothetical protein
VEIDTRRFHPIIIITSHHLSTAMCRRAKEDEGETGDRSQPVRSSSAMKHSASLRSGQTYHFATRNRQHSILQCLLFLVTAVFLIIINDPHGVIRSSYDRSTTAITVLPPRDTISNSSSSFPRRPNSLLHKLGWLDTITYFQKEIAVVANQMYRENLHPHLNQTGVINIAPLQTVISQALDEVGVRGLYFQVFSHDNTHLVFYYNFNATRKYCSKQMHGVTCQSHQPWWFYHFVGAITADKLLKEDRLLWDGSSGDKKYVEDMADLLHQIHLVQNSTWVGDFSFHAQHALEWQYVADTMPDILEYPVDLAQRFCGDFQHDNRKIIGQTMEKRIGYECYHGMGHAMFYLAMLRQVSRMTTEASIQQFGLPQQDIIMPQNQFRPNSGLELTQRSICEIKKLCADAPGAEEALPGKVTCWGGVIHSIRLYTNRPILYQKVYATKLLERRFQRCDDEDDDIAWKDMDDTAGYESDEPELERIQVEKKNKKKQKKDRNKKEHSDDTKGTN